MELSFQPINNFVEDDEVCRVTSDGDLQFGIILKEIDKKTYEVDWKSRSKQTSFLETNVKPSGENPVTLIDRRHSEGAKVLHTDGRIGTIVDGHTLAWIYLPDSRHIVKDVPSELLETITLFTGELIEFNGWIGKVSSVDWLVTVQYNDGMQCNLKMQQTHQSNTSFGYEVYSKLSPPSKNQIVQPTEKEYDSAEWHGTSFFDRAKQVIDEHFQKSATVMGSKICKVYVKWLCKLDYAYPSLTAMPRSLDTEHEIDAIKQFDIRFKTWLKTHSFCEYTIGEEDQFIDEDNFDKTFISELERSREECSGPAKKIRVEAPSKSKVPESGTSVLAEVIRLRHFYRVRWTHPTSEIESDPLENVLGTSLTHWSGTPLSPYGFDIRKLFKREFVESKVSFPLIEKIEDVFGVTQNRYLRDELVEVIWYQKESGGAKILGESVLPPYELLPHKEFCNVKPGAVVIISVSQLKDCSNPRKKTVGMIERITQSGMIEVKCAIGFTTAFVPPSELVVLSFPTDEFVLPAVIRTLSNDIDAEKLEFAQSLANDFEELLSISPADIKIKLSPSDSWDSFSVLIIGPKNTPYEDGIFIFDVRLPREYPNVAPKIRFRSLPKGNAFLSPNLTSDGEVCLWMFQNWPGTEEEEWSREYSLLDFLVKIRDGIFVREPFMNKADLKFDKSKDRLAATDVKVLAAMTLMNASVVVTVFDLMLSLYDNPPEDWKTEITEHIKAVAPQIKHRFQSWVDSPVGIYGDLREYPKHHIFPISYGLKQALSRRIGLLNEIMKMSIVFPDHVTAYYIPNAVHLYNVFKNSQYDYPPPPILEGNAAVARRRMLEYRYKDHTVVPVASTLALGDFVTTQKVESHPFQGFQGKSWCVIEYEYPPDQKKECHYMVAMDQALLEGYDAIIIEPFTVSQRAEQWINITSLIYSGFSAYLSLAIVASIHSPLMDPAPAVASIFSIYLLRTYRKYIQGDPIAVYRNFNFESNEDMTFMYHMSELLDVHARFTNVLVKDVRRDRYRLNILRGLILSQFFIVSYKYAFGMFLRVAFSDRPL